MIFMLLQAITSGWRVRSMNSNQYIATYQSRAFKMQMLSVAVAITTKTRALFREEFGAYIDLVLAHDLFRDTWLNDSMLAFQPHFFYTRPWIMFRLTPPWSIDINCDILAWRSVTYKWPCSLRWLFPNPFFRLQINHRCFNAKLLGYTRKLKSGSKFWSIL